MLDINWGGDVLDRPRFLSPITGFMLKCERENGGLGALPPEKFLLATPFRLRENTFSASSSTPGLLEN